VIERDDAAGGGAFGHEGVVAVPRADVEDRLARQVRQLEPNQLLMVMLERLAPRGHHALSDPNRVVPRADLIDQPLLRLAVQFLHVYLNTT